MPTREPWLIARLRGLSRRIVAVFVTAIAVLSGIFGALYSWSGWPVAVSACFLVLFLASLPRAYDAIRPAPTPSPAPVAEETPTPKPDCAESTLSATSPRHFSGLGFAEKTPTEVKLIIGSDTYFKSAEELEKHVAQPIMLGAQSPFDMYMVKGRVYVDTKIANPEDGAVFSVTRDQIDPGRSTNVDFNYTANALEVVDSKGNPIFQLIRKHADTIMVRAVLPGPAPGTYIFFDDDGMMIDRGYRKLNVQRIFAYPGWKYPGCYAS